MGLRATWESEESRRKRLADPNWGNIGGNAQNVAAPFVNKASDISRIGAEEAMAQGQRASDAIVQGSRDEGRIIGEGIPAIVNAGISNYQNASDRAFNREQKQREMSMAEEQRAEQRQAAADARQRSQLEMQYLPAKYAQEQRMGEAQIGQAQGNIEEQQLRLAGARAQSAYLDSDAAQAGLPDANPGEPVRVYMMRMEQQEKLENLKLAQNNAAMAVEQLAEFKGMAPYRKAQIVGELRAQEDAMKTSAINRSVAELNRRTMIDESNIKRFSAELQPLVGTPAFMAKKDEMVRGGVPVAIVAQAANAAMSNSQAAQMQQQLIERQDPRFAMAMEKINKADKYMQALSILKQNADSVDKWSIVDSPVETQAIQSIQQALVDVGKPYLAEKIGKSFTMGDGLTPTTRKTLINQAISALKNEMGAEIKSGLMDVNSPTVRNLWQEVNNKWEGLESGPRQPSQNLFGNLRTHDFSGGSL